MERKIVKFLEHWKDEPLRKPLVVYGSKQVGKTYTVLEFGEKNYNNVVYIDANDDVILSQNLKKEKTMDSVISYLSSYTQSQINKNDTLVVIDNVNSVNIVNAIKTDFFNLLIILPFLNSFSASLSLFLLAKK